jgi:hypothetical protein
MAEDSPASAEQQSPLRIIDAGVALPPGAAGRFTIEPPEEAEHRRKEEAARAAFEREEAARKAQHERQQTDLDAAHRQATERRNWWLAVVVGCGILLFSMYYSFAGPTDDLRKLGLGLVGATFTGLLGFLLGQAQAPKK